MANKNRSRDNNKGQIKFLPGKNYGGIHARIVRIDANALILPTAQNRHSIYSNSEKNRICVCIPMPSFLSFNLFLFLLMFALHISNDIFFFEAATPHEQNTQISEICSVEFDLKCAHLCIIEVAISKTKTTKIKQMNEFIKREESQYKNCTE